MSSTKNDSTYFAALTGVRAIAAYMVYLHHYNFVDKNIFGQTIQDFASELHIGVTLFFVLSGFLIGYRYLEMQNFSFRNYIVNRIARIYPMYFILTTLTFILHAIYKNQYFFNDFIRYFMNISFLRGFSDSLKFTLIAQGWSLTVEETFYFLAPLFFILIRKNILNLLILLIFLIFVGLGLVYIFQNIPIFGITFFEHNEFMFNYTFFGRCSEFFIGIGLAIFFKQKSQPINYKYLTYIGLAVIITCVYGLSLLKGGGDYGIRHPFGKVINTFLLPLFGIAIFYYGLLTEKTMISKILSSKLFILLGKSSYIFYLIHIGVFAAVIKTYFLNDFMSFFVSQNKFFLECIILFVPLNIIAILMFKYIEEPLNHTIRQKFRTKQSS